MKKVKLRIKLGFTGSLKEHTIKAYMTEVAGLVVHPEVMWDTRDDRAIIKRNCWAITQYPTGKQAFTGILTMQEAIDIVVTEMKPFNWVGMTIKDALAVNDTGQLQQLALKIEARIANNRQIWCEAENK